MASSLSAKYMVHRSNHSRTTGFADLDALSLPHLANIETTYVRLPALRSGRRVPMVVLMITHAASPVYTGCMDAAMTLLLQNFIVAIATNKAP